MSLSRNQLSNADESNLADIYLMCKIGEEIQFVLLTRHGYLLLKTPSPTVFTVLRYLGKTPYQIADHASRTAGRHHPWIPRYLVVPASEKLSRRKLWHRDATPILL